MILLVVQISEVAKEYPYFFTYRNQIISESVSLNSYCALMDEAGEYLSKKPNAKELTVLSWYGPGCLSFFFSGKTLPLWPKSYWDETNINKLLTSDYLIITEGTFSRKNLSSLLIGLENETPEKVISFQGNDYVWIYKVDDLPESIFLLEN